MEIPHENPDVLRAAHPYEEVSPTSRNILLNSTVELFLPTSFEAPKAEDVSTDTGMYVLNLDPDSPQGYWHEF